MKKNDAVSEVVGVMLMLTVTIMLVAVVGATVSGLVSVDNDPVSAELIFVGYNGTNLIFENVAGDPISLSKMKLVLSARDHPSRREVFNSSNIVSTGGATVSVGNRFSVPSNFSASEYLIYQVYDIEAGILISSGEIPPNN